MLKLNDPELAKLRFECYRESIAMSIRVRISGGKVTMADLKKGADEILAYALDANGETVTE